MEESKRDKFIRLKDSRLAKFKDIIRLMGNFTNGSVYEYTEKDVDILIADMRAEIDDLEAVLKGKKKFSLEG